MPRVAAAALAALAPLLAGCLFGMCGLSPNGAEWEDPALFAAMPPPGVRDGATSAHEPPAEGLPFARSVNPALGPHNLTSLAWSWPPEAPRVGLTLAPPQRAYVSFEASVPPADARAAVREFLGHVSAANASELDAAADALLAAAEELGHDEGLGPDDPRQTVGSGPVPGPLRLEALHDGLVANGALRVEGLSARAGAWEFALSAQQRVLTAPDGASLTVGPLGRARFAGLAEGERSEEAYAKDLLAWLRRHGLPEPDPQAVQVQGSIC